MQPTYAPKMCKERKMGKMSRTKGQSGEREVAELLRELTGLDIRRRVRQHDGDSDLEGAPNWCIEVKRHATATRGDIRGWWEQAERQAGLAGGLRPVLIYRRDRDEWRAVWLIDEALHGYGWTCEGSVEFWARYIRGPEKIA